MIISVDDVNFTVDNPKYDYEVNIMPALIHTAMEPKNYGVWDNGSGNDIRTLGATWLMSAALTNTLLEIFNDLNKGRGISVTFKLGNESGFYPFGPDHGDAGDFGVRMTSINALPVMTAPWLYFNTQIEFVEESNPAYNLPAEFDCGDLQIGSITGLRQPPDFPQSSTDYNFSTQITRDGSPFTIDKVTDAFTTTLAMVLRHNKAAALIDHMMGTVRNNDLTIVAQANNYLFGRENAGAGTYICQWLNEIIKIVHVRYDQFNFGLTFSHRSG